MQLPRLFVLRIVIVIVTIVIIVAVVVEPVPDFLGVRA